MQARRRPPTIRSPCATRAASSTSARRTRASPTEIAAYTKYFIEHTVEDRGWFRVVEPTLVVEIAFNAIMKSDRHASGFALRFPRIVRVRDDKPPADASTLDDARAVPERQHRPARDGEAR